MRNLANLLEDVMVLVPIALIIFVRVFAGAVKAKADRKAAAAREAPLPAPGASPTGKAAAPDAAARGKRGSIVALVERLQGKAPAEDASSYEPLHFEVAERSAPATRSPSAYGEKRPGVGRYDIAPLEPSLEPPPSPGSMQPVPSAADASLARVAPAAPAFAFPAAVERLPPLKKAVALSLVLGRPRASEP